MAFGYPMNAAVVINQRIPGREHFPIPSYSRRWYAMRVAQFLGAILCLSLAAFAQANWRRSKAAPLTIVTALSTFIVLVYYVVAQFGPPAAYNYWAVIALDAYLTLFWFVSFVLLSSEVADDFATGLGGDFLASAQGLAAAIIFAALECSSFATLLGFLAYRVHHHRAAGLHSSPIIHDPQSEEIKLVDTPPMQEPADLAPPPASYPPYRSQYAPVVALGQAAQQPYPTVQYQAYRPHSFIDPAGLARQQQQPYSVPYQPYRSHSYIDAAALAHARQQTFSSVQYQPPLSNGDSYPSRHHTPTEDMGPTGPPQASSPAESRSSPPNAYAAIQQQHEAYAAMQQQHQQHQHHQHHQQHQHQQHQQHHHQQQQQPHDPYAPIQRSDTYATIRPRDPYAPIQRRETYAAMQHDVYASMQPQAELAVPSEMDTIGQEPQLQRQYTQSPELFISKPLPPIMHVPLPKTPPPNPEPIQRQQVPRRDIPFQRQQLQQLQQQQQQQQQQQPQAPEPAQKDVESPQKAAEAAQAPRPSHLWEQLPPFPKVVGTQPAHVSTALSRASVRNSWTPYTSFRSQVSRGVLPYVVAMFGPTYNM